VDAIFQVVYRKQSVLLIVFAFILSGLYPFIRGKIIDGQIDTRAIVSMVIYFIGFIVFITTIF
ncbi:MAG: hypothetical protein K6E10_10335, partial [Eubacterium sp.]|nr:hypothetical protein [Eubacterium sp.]